MTSGSVTEIGAGRLLIDLGFRDRDGLIASYLIPGAEGWTIVETGPGSCREALEHGVSRAGVDPAEIVRILVTHIHLDHSGGLGVVAETFPRAELYAHAEGVPHLVDPTRLIASARRAWGPASDSLWGPIAPVPADRLHPLTGGEEFPVLGGTLRVLATPGHARHHLSYLDAGPGNLLTGDSAGIRLPGDDSARPAVPPPDLDLDLLMGSLDRMIAAAPRSILYAHYGPFPQATRDLSTYRTRVLEWCEVARASALKDPRPPAIGEALREHEISAGRAPPIGSGQVDRSDLVSGYEMAAAGLLRYLRQTGRVPG
ncbi:MAG: MBL fold metallo-hydrolase [Thermoplasmata archaeon]|nr:MBL fold metallo-hydrolase [Thermoplasmata archaeon]